MPVNLDGKFGPVDLSRLPIVIGEGRLARRLRGTLDATVEGRGSLQAPTLVAEARTTQLGAGETPLGKAEVKLDYRQARSQLRAALEFDQRRCAEPRRAGGPGPLVPGDAARTEADQRAHSRRR